MPSPVPVTRAEAIAKACQAIEDVRFSRAATQHAIEQSRKSLVETHAFAKTADQSIRDTTTTMPTYQYRCENCGKTFERSETIAEHEALKPMCPECRSKKVSFVPGRFYVVTSKKS
jgi:putative FmdB family regulatory protein